MNSRIMGLSSYSGTCKVCSLTMVANQRICFLLLILFVQSVWLHDGSDEWEAGEGGDGGACMMRLSCAECVPDSMPLVLSPAAEGGAVRARAGQRVALSCGAARFVAYPARAQLQAACEGGRYRVQHDGSLRTLLELGCQESVFEDVLHHVEHCELPHQGRAYRVREENGTRLVATLCFDADHALPLHVHMTSAAALNTAPEQSRAPLSLLGNFAHMFDGRTRHEAEMLFSDDESANRRLREMTRHTRHRYAGQRLTAHSLLGHRYFPERYTRVAEFASARVPAWASVVHGNLRALQTDVARALHTHAGTRALHVHAGTHGVAAFRTDAAPVPLHLKPEQRFPVPRYVWTVVHEPAARRAVALVTLNDPFVAVSQIKSSVFCESVCGSLPWLRELRRHRRYETPLYGLVFCCSVHNFTAVVEEMPEDIVSDVPFGEDGLLTTL